MIYNAVADRKIAHGVAIFWKKFNVIFTLHVIVILLLLLLPTRLCLHILGTLHEIQTI